MKLLIATPAALGMVTTVYSESLFSLRDALARRGIAHGYKTTAMSDLELSRNYLASLALAEGYSHLLFIDADMGFLPRAVERLIDSGKPVVGAVYAKRHVDLFGLLDDVRPEDRNGAGWQRRVISRNMDFVGEPLAIGGKHVIEVKDGFARFALIGMGLALISCDALRTMLDQQVVALHTDTGFKARFPTYGFFDRGRGPAGLFSDDASFCMRWAKCGGEVWACVDEVLSHVGSHNFMGSYIDKIRQQQLNTP